MNSLPNEKPWEKEETKDTFSWRTRVPWNGLYKILVAGAATYILTKFAVLPITDHYLGKHLERIESQDSFEDLQARSRFYVRLGTRVENLGLTYGELTNALCIEKRIGVFRKKVGTEFDSFPTTVTISFPLGGGVSMFLQGLQLVDNLTKSVDVSLNERQAYNVLRQYDRKEGKQ